jgi:hypothetical protein
MNMQFTHMIPTEWNTGSKQNRNKRNKDMLSENGAERTKGNTVSNTRDRSTDTTTGQRLGIGMHRLRTPPRKKTISNGADDSDETIGGFPDCTGNVPTGDDFFLDGKGLAKTPDSLPFLYTDRIAKIVQISEPSKHFQENFFHSPDFILQVSNHNGIGKILRPDEDLQKGGCQDPRIS